MCHRIHEESETSKIIGDNARSVEDLVMFKKFWPDVIAKRLAKIYSTSEKSNELKLHLYTENNWNVECVVCFTVSRIENFVQAESCCNSSVLSS